MPVTVVVEDGSGVAGANAYLSVAGWKVYADQLGWDYATAAFSNDQLGSAIIRGRAWLDAAYRSRWPGYRTGGRAQSTAWPRTDVVDGDGEDIDDDEIPAEIVQAASQAAWRELQEPGSLSPDLERGGAISSLKAGSVEITYASSAPGGTVRTVIDDLIAGLLLDLPSSTNVSWPMRA